MRFLGSVPKHHVPGIARALADACSTTPPFTLELGDAGSFGGGRRGRVVWVGLRRGGPEVAALARSLARLLGQDASEPFHAHLTVARQADASVLPALDSALASAGLIAWTADRLVLYRSQLGSGPPRHEPISEAVLGS